MEIKVVSKYFAFNHFYIIRWLLWQFCTKLQKELNMLLVKVFARGGDSHIKWTGMLVGNFEFNP